MISPRILFVASVAPHLLYFHTPSISTLQGMGYEVHVACDAQGYERALERHGVKVWQVPFSRSPWRLRNIKALLALVRLLRTQHYALVHVHTPVAGFLTRVAACFSKVPAVLYTVHGFHFYRGSPLHNWLLYFPVERALARCTDGLIVMNEEDWSRARRWPVRGHVHFVPGVGVPLDDSPLSASGLTTVPDACDSHPSSVALMVCELSPTKNVSLALRAWRLVKAERPEAVLLIAGDGSQRHKLERLAARLGVSDCVRFLGFRRDVPELIRLSSLLVASSKREGLPRAVLEAMVAAKPVVATDVRGQRDLVEDGQNGLLVPPGAPGRLARAILRLLNDASLAAALGAEGKRRSVAYGIPAVSRTMLDIYGVYLAGATRVGSTEQRHMDC